MTDEAQALPVSAVAPLLEPYLLPGRAGARGAVLAVSGGPDSMALMRIAAELRGRGALVPIVVATVDHGLRPDSRSEAKTVGEWAKACGFPHRLLDWSGPKPRSRVQEAAREARYRLLANLAEELRASHVLTAHTLDDQAETILMRISRGTDIGGLAGMRRDSSLGGVTLSRPFLGLRKAQLVGLCRAHGWPFIEDPSNLDPRFARSRWRALMPALAGEGLTPERLSALGARARRAEEALEAHARVALAQAVVPRADGLTEVRGELLLDEPDAILLRALAQALAAVAAPEARPIRLERLEAHVLGKIRPGLAAGIHVKVNLGGVLIDIGEDRRIRLAPEPRRRRSRRSQPVAAAAPHSLGKGGRRT